jgi:hypothetical protein
VVLLSAGERTRVISSFLFASLTSKPNEKRFFKVVLAMPGCGKKRKLASRPGLPASEIETRIMRLIRKSGGRPRLQGVALVYVGSLGTEPNWFARPIPPKVSPKCMKLFVTALAQVRKEYDLVAGTASDSVWQLSERSPRVRSVVSIAEPILSR